MKKIKVLRKRMTKCQVDFEFVPFDDSIVEGYIDENGTLFDSKKNSLKFNISQKEIQLI